ncbi:hypothetical protein [Lentzea sp. E54]|uniref:hypothetical protein n=1 Tax=Lentzea xerophila TaxID=3435883 RepID=UPI003DA5E660
MPKDIACSEQMVSDWDRDVRERAERRQPAAIRARRDDQRAVVRSGIVADAHVKTFGGK